MHRDRALRLRLQREASVAATWSGVNTKESPGTWQLAHERPFVPANGVLNSADRRAAHI